jgi:catechol 2,3-dioxygenase-like lactoylglutathione lyase family enzyme
VIQSNSFRTLHHVCVVVRDIEKATAYYESLGIGPWLEFPSLEAFRHDLQAPDPEGFFKLRYRYVNLDNFQLQLCEPPEGNTPQRQFLEEHGEGVFHLGFTVPDCDQAEDETGELGLKTLIRGRLPAGGGFNYFQTARNGAGVTLEIRANMRS